MRRILPRLALSAPLVLLLLATTAAAQGSRDHEFATGPAPDAGPDTAATMLELAAGDTVRWRHRDGTTGGCVLAATSGTCLDCTDGRRIDTRDLDGLWQRHWSRATAFRRGSTMGFLAGLVGGMAVLNTNARDDGSLVNLGAAASMVLLVGGGTLTGMAVGAAAPPAGSWERVLGEPRISRSEAPWREGPPDAGPSLEVGAEVATIGWWSRHQGAVRGTVGIWLPVMTNADAGIDLSLGTAPDFDRPEVWSEDLAVSASGGVRIRIAGGGALTPYVLVGGGWYGDLGETVGWKLGMGLQGRVIGRSAMRLEVGTIGGLEQIDGDRPGQAYAAVRFGVDLGESRHRE
ncbi:hypothetical protein GF314_09950 [bacterium]|nr:hypothetical protein [bacterium]